MSLTKLAYYMAGVLFLAFLGFSCSNNAKHNVEKLPDGFKEVKLLQKLPDDIILDSEKDTSENSVTYSVDGKKKNLGELFDTKIAYVDYTTKDNTTKIINVMLLNTETKQILDRIISRFGNPDTNCTVDITREDAKLNYAGHSLRWSDNSDFSLQFNTPKKNDNGQVEIVIIANAEVKKYDSEVGPGVSIAVECKKYSPAKTPDKDGL